MYKKHLSEKIAQVFFVVGIIFLIPGMLGLLPATLIMLLGFFAMQGEVFLCGFISLLIFAAGMALFVGYSKHSSGTLDENKILPLWFGTLIYNGFPLFMTILSLIFGGRYSYFEAGNFGLFSTLVIGWWILATCLSLTAIYDEFEHSKL